ncbi:MAG TPA: SDR family oxidoreductase [Acidobacteriota bacterium]
MELGLAGKTVLITGASGGIGQALALAFGAEGARLVLTAHRQLAALEQFCAGQPWRDQALILACDVTLPEQLRAAFDRARDRFGRVDVCVANSGIWPEPELRLDQMDERRIRETLEINLHGSLWTAREFMRALAQSGPDPAGHGACLILIGSTAGRFGERGHSEYSISKAGLYGLLRTLKNEIVAIDPYARVNLVEPGWTVTPMSQAALDQPGAIERSLQTMPLRQLARPEDIAGAVLFFASPLAARHISGERLTVAGGMEGRLLWERSAIDPNAVKRRLQPDQTGPGD